MTSPATTDLVVLSTLPAPVAIVATATPPGPTDQPDTTVNLLDPTALPSVVAPAVVDASPVPATESSPPPTPPHPLYAYTIPGLRERSFPGGIVETIAVLEENGAYTRSYIAYPSDGLTITGMMHTPVGAGPFPVLVLVHAYWERDGYFAGAGTWQAADYYARQGYLVLAPDLRSWGQAESGLSLFQTGLVADVLNLISSLPSLPAADPERVGLWGHSMGGGIVTKVLTVDDRVRAAVLYAPNSADDADLLARWGPGCLPEQPPDPEICNPSEVILPDTPVDIVDAYLAAVTDRAFLQQVAPLYHLDLIQAPVQIHIGLKDGELRSHTPPEWSEKLAAALEAAGRDVEYFAYPEQGHFFEGEGWTMLMERSRAFFDAQLKPPQN